MTGDSGAGKSLLSVLPKELEAATGTKNVELQFDVVNQILDTLWLPPNMSEAAQHNRIKAALAALKGIKPCDEIESLLATQMIATHNAAMECLRRGMLPTQTFEGREQSLKHAAKLLSLYAKQMETLDKHRGRGHQKITVERVNVGSGGQAIVGNVASSREVLEKPSKPKTKPKR